MPVKTIPIKKMQKLEADKRAVIITTGFNQQMALVKTRSGQFFAYQRMLENFVLL